MEEKDVKGRVVSGFAWTVFEKVMSRGVGLVVSIILARLIAPEAYGLIAIVQVFTSIALVFAQSGISNALIQKKEIDSTDYSTAYIVCVGAAVLLYIVLFFCSPLVARVYDNPNIIVPLRVMGLSIIITSYNSVQQAYVSRNMQFKKFFYATLIGNVVSGIVGIIVAYKTKSVWALIIQSMLSNILNTLVLLFQVPEKPKCLFSFSKMKEIYKYGWKLLASSLLHTVYADLFSLLIGKKYTPTSLAYYQKGKTYPVYLYETLLMSMSRVLFPALSAYQDDSNQRLQIARRSVQMGMFFLTPMLVGFAVVSRPFVEVLLTEKWLPCVPFLILQCVFYIVQPIKTTCFENLKAIGMVSLYLKQEIIRKIIDIVLVIVSIVLFDSPIMFIAAIVLSYYGTTIIDVILLNKYMSYDYSKMFFDTFPPLIMSIVMGLIVFLVGNLKINVIYGLILQILSGVISYLVMAIITKNKSFQYLILVLSKKK